MGRNNENKLFARSLVAFLSHFAGRDDVYYGLSDIPLPSDSDPLGAELLSRHPYYPPSIATEGPIAAVSSWINWTESAAEGADAAQQERPQHGVSLASACSSCGIPQSLAVSRGSQSSLEDGIRQGDPPGPRELCRMASSCMLSAFDFSDSVRGDNMFRANTDRPAIPASKVAMCSEYVIGIILVFSLWYHYASHASARPVMDNMRTWMNDRVPGARTSVPPAPKLSSPTPLFTAKTDKDILSSIWSTATRAVGKLRPTGYQANFAEFYSLMALRCGMPLVSCDGTVVTDYVAVIQITAQVPTLGYDIMSGDQRGATIFFDSKLGKAWATRFLAAARWYTHCSPSCIGLVTIPSGLYAFASQRHGLGYWQYVRPRLIQARGRTSSFDLPVCTPSFWYNGGLEGSQPPPPHPCNHHQPMYHSPFTGLIDVLSSVTEYENYDDWRSQVDRSVASIDSWLRDQAAQGQQDIYLRATTGASSSFLALLSRTLAAVLE